MECNAFHVSYLSDKIPEAAFHGQAVRTVAYLRVSTAQQNLRSQRLAILEYARKHDFRIDDFIAATVWSSANSPGSVGALGQIVAILDAIAKAGVAFVAMKENIRVEGKRDIQTKVMTTLFALFAEVERDVISERPTKRAMCTNGTFPRARRGLFMLLAALGFRLRRGCGGARTARTEGGLERPPVWEPRFGRGTPV